jgi:hypothetical protein
MTKQLPPLGAWETESVPVWGSVPRRSAAAYYLTTTTCSKGSGKASQVTYSISPEGRRYSVQANYLFPSGSTNTLHMGVFESARAAHAAAAEHYSRVTTTRRSEQRYDTAVRRMAPRDFDPVAAIYEMDRERRQAARQADLRSRLAAARKKNPAGRFFLWTADSLGDQDARRLGFFETRDAAADAADALQARWRKRGRRVIFAVREAR